MRRFIIKKKQERKTKFINKKPSLNEKVEITKENNIKNKENEQNNVNVMDTKEKIELANQILEQEPKVKRIKKDKGLIERVESSKSILTEDNRELLRD